MTYNNDLHLPERQLTFRKLLLVFSVSTFLLHLFTAPAKSQNYTWGNVTIIAGGFVDGILFHPASKDVAYLRTDMGGAYRLDPSTRKWVPITDMFGNNDWTLYGIESIGLDPTDPNRVYMAAGTYTNSWSGNGAILRSTDKGTTWDRIDMNFKFGGNEDGRSMGERLAVDPNNPTILFLGTRKNGLWKSADRGSTWTQVTSFPVTTTTTNGVGIGWIVFDKSSGTSGTATPTLYAGIADNGTNLYKSTNGGATWTAVAGQPSGMQPHHALIASNGQMYVSYGDNAGPNGMTMGAVWKYNITSGAWTNVSPPTGQGGFAGLSVDATNPNIVMVGTMDRWYPGDEIYRTTNGGSSWIAVGTGSKVKRDASLSPYIRFGAANDNGLGTGNWVGALAIDPYNSNRVYYATGATVWESDNISNGENGLTVNWTIGAAGVEQNAVLELTSPPSGPQLYSAMGDIGGFAHYDVNVSPAAGMEAPFYNTVSSIDFAASKPMTVVRAGSGARGGVSTDGGLNFNEFANIPTALADGNIAISSDGTTLVWAGATAGPYRSTNAGQSWTASTGISGSGWIASDRVNAKKFYLVTGGKLYYSTDGGASFAGGATGLTGSKLKAVPGLEGNVWLPGSNGLYRSVDGGASFTKITGVQSADAVGFGMAATGQTHPAVFITGSVNNQYGVYRSDNAGGQWVRINDNNHQFGNIAQSITGDPRIYGRIYIATNGRGIIMGSLAAVTGVEDATGMDETSLENVVCYPNPFTESFHFSAMAATDYTIYDLIGNAVEKGNTATTANPGGVLKPGTYLVKLSNSAGNQHIKLIKLNEN